MRAGLTISPAPRDGASRPDTAAGMMKELHASVEMRNAGQLAAVLQKTIPDYTPSECGSREAALARGTGRGALR